MNILDKEVKKIKIDNEYFSDIKKKTYPIIKDFENFYKILNKKQNEALEKYKNDTFNIYALLNNNTLILNHHLSGWIKIDYFSFSFKRVLINYTF